MKQWMVPVLAVILLLNNAQVTAQQVAPSTLQSNEPQQRIETCNLTGMPPPKTVSSSPSVPNTTTVGYPLWNQFYGGSDRDAGYAMVECAEGGFALIGSTSSFGAGSNDLWLIRTDVDGNHLWNRTYSNFGAGISMAECNDGGFILAGRPCWLIRTDTNGYHLWNRSYSGYALNDGISVVECSDSGFAFVCSMPLIGSGFDMWLVRTDPSGNHLWNHTYSGVEWNYEYGYSVVECGDGGFALACNIVISGYGNDFIYMWLVRTDATGHHLWNHTYSGGDFLTEVYSVVLCSDGGFALTGITGPTYAATDMWLVRTDATGHHLWNHTYGIIGGESGYSVVEVSTGGFAISGDTERGGYDKDVWLVRTDDNGNYRWSRRYGDFLDDLSRSLVEVREGGFALCSIYGIGDSSNVWLLRVLDPPLWWVEVPTNQSVEWGASFNYDLNASAVSPIGNWWLNDNLHFAVDDQGVVTSVSVLPVGVYLVVVGVNDTHGNFLNGTFTLFVEMSPQWIFLINRLAFDLFTMGSIILSVVLIIYFLFHYRRRQKPSLE